MNAKFEEEFDKLIVEEIAIDLKKYLATLERENAERIWELWVSMGIAKEAQVSRKRY